MLANDQYKYLGVILEHEYCTINLNKSVERYKLRK